MANYQTIADRDVKNDHELDDTMVVLAGDQIEAKIIKHDGTPRISKSGFRYKYEAMKVNDLYDLLWAVSELQSEYYSFPIRGAVIAEAPAEIQRTSNPIKNNDEHNIVDAGRIWVMIDIDGCDYVVPPDWRDRKEEVARAVIRECLPDEFQEAGCVIAMSGSAKSEGGEVKMHLFFIFDRPVWSHELKTLMQHRFPCRGH